MEILDFVLFSPNAKLGSKAAQHSPSQATVHLGPEQAKGEMLHLYL